MTQPIAVDRLAMPTLPDSPTQAESGRYLYYFHCMPCHGDRGQGLTDEWRQVWVEDHQNCWARGCHAGRSELDAFLIPHFIPPTMGSAQALKSFRSAEDLFVFLHETQPPQRPGALSDDEYWALTAFLLQENGRLQAGTHLGAADSHAGELPTGAIAAGIVALFGVLFLAPGTRQVRRWLTRVTAT